MDKSLLSEKHYAEIREIANRTTGHLKIAHFFAVFPKFHKICQNFAEFSPNSTKFFRDLIYLVNRNLKIMLNVDQCFSIFSQNAALKVGCLPEIFPRSSSTLFSFFAVSCPENSAFFRKNRQIFEKNPRKILHILNILEKCCILEKSRKNLVNLARIQQNSGKICEILGKTEKNQQFLTKILRLENGAKECTV